MKKLTIYRDANGNPMGTPFKQPDEEWVVVEETQGTIYKQAKPKAATKILEEEEEWRKREERRRQRAEEQMHAQNRALREKKNAPAPEPAACDVGSRGGYACVQETLDRTKKFFGDIFGYDVNISADIGHAEMVVENPLSVPIAKGGADLGGRAVPLGGVSITEKGVAKVDLVPGPLNVELGANLNEGTTGGANIATDTVVKSNTGQALIKNAKIKP